MKTILIMIGTRPECIKLAPLVMALKAREQDFRVVVCLTSQHREMLQQALDWLPIDIDFDLDLMRTGQNLVELQANIMMNLKPVVEQCSPDYVIVQGDTTTAMASAMTACFMDIPVVHLEAGLRTFNRHSPWPEEINRQLISKLATVHLAPTENNAEQLRREKVDGDVLVVGNTVIDALLQVRARLSDDAGARRKIEQQLESAGLNVADQEHDKPFILVTGHRRESFGEGMIGICDALQHLANAKPELQIVYAVHLNPAVKDVVHERLSSQHNIHLLPPLEYGPFVYLMDRCTLILTDSGGIQEEAPSLGKPVLVMRETTERTEAVDSGAVKLVGTNSDAIVSEALKLLDDPAAYASMANVQNPYGTGLASVSIARYLAAQS